MSRIEIVRDDNLNHIYKYLSRMDEYYIPRLSSLVDIVEYSQKLSENAFTYFARSNEGYIGIVSFYINQKKEMSFITTISVENCYRCKGIGKMLISQVENMSKIYKTISKIKLEVSRKNVNAITFYKRNGYKYLSENKNIDMLTLVKYIKC